MKPFFVSLIAFWSLFSLNSYATPCHLAHSQYPSLGATNRIAKNFVSTSEQNFLAHFSQSGFKSMDEFRSAVGMAGPRAIRLRELLLNKARVAIRVPSRIRDLVMEQGFLNVHETGQSLKGGTSKPTARNWLESGMLGVSLQEYTEAPSQAKPKYGFVIGSKEEYSKTPIHAYGEDVWHIDPMKLDQGHRVTFFIGDSWLAAESRYPSKGWRAPDPTSSFVPGLWHERLIPWKYRELLVPFILHGRGEMESVNHGRRQPIQDQAFDVTYTNSNLKQHLEPVEYQQFSHLLWSTPSRPYIEAHVHGDDILKAVTGFSGLGATPEFLQKLNELGIEYIKP